MEDKFRELFVDIDTKTLGHLYWNPNDMDSMKKRKSEEYMRDLNETYKMLPKEGRVQMDNDLDESIKALKKGYNRLVSIVDKSIFHKLVWYKLVILRHKLTIRNFEKLYHGIVFKLGGKDPDNVISNEIDEMIRDHEKVINSYKKRYKRCLVERVSSSLHKKEISLRSILLSGQEEDEEEDEEGFSKDTSENKESSESKSLDDANDCLRVVDKVVVDTIMNTTLRKIINFENYISS